MGDTIRIEFTENWTEVTELVAGVSYSFQNVNSADMFIQQAPTQPGDVEIGRRLLPSKSARINKEASPVWVRSKTTKGIAVYNSLL